MILSETKDLLARVAAVDNRELSEAMAQEWHSIIGQLSYRVAERALILARRDPQIEWIQPKHILAKMHFAVAELNREEQLGKDSEDANWNPCDKPLNYDEMVEFYTKLYQANPWDTRVKTGMMTSGGAYGKPQPIIVRALGAELDRRIRAKADEIGWTIPEPRWN